MATSSPGPGERPGAEQDEIVRPRAEDDVLGLDARVLGDRGREAEVPSVRVPRHLGQGPRDRPGTGSGMRERSRVAVEADDLEGIEPDLPRELLRRRRPDVLRERVRQRSHRRTASACAGMPSSAASASTVGRTWARPCDVRRWTVTGFRNVSSPSPPTERAQPPVGSTWFAPVA